MYEAWLLKEQFLPGVMLCYAAHLTTPQCFVVDITAVPRPPPTNPSSDNHVRAGVAVCCNTSGAAAAVVWCAGCVSGSAAPAASSQPGPGLCGHGDTSSTTEATGGGLWSARTAGMCGPQRLTAARPVSGLCTNCNESSVTLLTRPPIDEQ